MRDATHLDELTKLKRTIEHLVSLLKLAVLDELASIAASSLAEPSPGDAAAKALAKVDGKVGEVAHGDGRFHVYLFSHCLPSIGFLPINLVVLKERLTEGAAMIWRPLIAIA